MCIQRSATCTRSNMPCGALLGSKSSCPFRTSRSCDGTFSDFQNRRQLAMVASNVASSTNRTGNGRHRGGASHKSTSTVHTWTGQQGSFDLLDGIGQPSHLWMQLALHDDSRIACDHLNPLQHRESSHRSEVSLSIRVFHERCDRTSPEWCWNWCAWSIVDRAGWTLTL